MAPDQQHPAAVTAWPTDAPGTTAAQRKAAGRATAQQPAPPAAPVVALAAPGPEQLMPVLLALTHSLVGRLPADDPARMAATDALALLSPPAHLHHG